MEASCSSTLVPNEKSLSTLPCLTIALSHNSPISQAGLVTDLSVASAIADKNDDGSLSRAEWRGLQDNSNVPHVCESEFSLQHPRTWRCCWPRSKEVSTSTGQTTVSFHRQHQRISESSGVARVYIQRESDSLEPLVVHYKTVDLSDDDIRPAGVPSTSGSAQRGLDYAPRLGKVEFDPDCVAQFIDIDVFNESSFFKNCDFSVMITRVEA